VAGRVIDSSLESSSLFSILAGERENRAFCQRLEPIWGSFFTLFGISP
jgi:hypothetical protein